MSSTTQKVPAAPIKKPYVLTRGEHHVAQDDGTNHIAKAGDTVMLTDNQFKAFSDKFKTAGEYNAEQKRSARVAAAIKRAEAEDAAEEAAEQAKLNAVAESDDDDAGNNGTADLEPESTSTPTPPKATAPKAPVVPVKATAPTATNTTNTTTKTA